MQIHFGRKKSLKLTDKVHPLNAIIATIIGVASVSLFITVCFVAGKSHGHGGIGLGALGILCFLMSLVGFLMTWVSLHQENIRPLFPTLAALINGTSLVFYLILYIMGMF